MKYKVEFYADHNMTYDDTEHRCPNDIRYYDDLDDAIYQKEDWEYGPNPSPDYVSLAFIYQSEDDGKTWEEL